jgi:hypothetical protein
MYQLKRLLLFCLLINSTFAAQAQIAQLVGLGLMVGVNAAAKDRTQKADQFVTRASYQSEAFAQKRTPADKLTGKGVGEISQVETLLQRFYAILTMDDFTEICPRDQYNAFQSAIHQVRIIRPKWDTEPYQEELEFYQRMDYNRTRRREDMARKLAEQQAQERRVHQLHRQDSIAQVNRRAEAVADSIAGIAKVRQDSLGRLAAIRAARTRFRYLNAYRTSMLTMPGAYNKPAVGEVWSGSKVTVVQRQANGWSYVEVNGIKGYLPSQRLVPVLDSVLVSGVDWESIHKYPDYAVVMTSGEHPPIAISPTALTRLKTTAQRRPAVPAVSRVRPVARSPRVYICGGGSAYAYHSSGNCSGLNRCTHGVSAISQTSAAEMGRRPCKKCY